jgi:hypothetical protein
VIAGAQKCYAGADCTGFSARLPSTGPSMQPPAKPPGSRDAAAVLLGYLNFSSGAFDAAAWRARNELFAAGEPAAEEVHSLFERHGEPATDEIVELPVALAGEGCQGPATVCGELWVAVSRGHFKIRADGVGNVSWERGACPWKRGLAASARAPAEQPDHDPAPQHACWR